MAHIVVFPLVLEQNVLHGCCWWLLSLKPYLPNIYLLTVLPVLLLTPQCSLQSLPLSAWRFTCHIALCPRCLYSCFRSRAVFILQSEVQSSTIRGGTLLSQYVNNECSVEQRQKLCAFTRIWLLLLSRCLGGYDVLLSVFRPWFCFLIRRSQPTEIWKTKGASARKLQLQHKNAGSTKSVQNRLQHTCASNVEESGCDCRQYVSLYTSTY